MNPMSGGLFGLAPQIMQQDNPSSLGAGGLLPMLLQGSGDKSGPGLDQAKRLSLLAMLLGG